MAQNGEAESLDPPVPTTRLVGGTEYSWCKAVPIGTGSTVLSLLLSKPPQIPLLQNALHKLQNSHPILRSKIQLDHSTNNFHFVTPPNSRVQIQPFDLQSTSHILQTRSNGDDPIDSFHALLEHEMNRDTWRDPKVDYDVMYASMYEIGDDRFAVFLRLHTSACDRAAAVSLLKELLRLVATGGGGDDGGGVREEKVNPTIEDMIPEGKTNKPFWARGMDVLGYSLNALRFANLSFVNAESPRSSRIVRFQLNAEETKNLLAVSHFHYLLSH